MKTSQQNLRLGFTVVAFKQIINLLLICDQNIVKQLLIHIILSIRNYEICHLNSQKTSLSGYSYVYFPNAFKI